MLERVKGIEPSSQAWEARILPLNHTRFRGVPSLFSIEGRSRQSINDVAASRDRSWVERNVEFQYLLTVNLVPQ